MELRSRIPPGPIEGKWDKHRFEMKLVNPANKRKFTVIVVGTGLAGGPAPRLFLFYTLKFPLSINN
jgi:succinate dehydrogenase / fumarate reductase flavoprotein subunit